MIDLDEHSVRLASDPIIRLFCIDGDGDRFARLFKDVWECLDADERSALRGFIEAVMLVENDKGFSPESSAYYSPLDKTIHFSASCFDSGPDDIMRFIIAHELAHAFRSAHGLSKFGTQEDEWQTDQQAEEWLVDWYTPPKKAPPLQAVSYDPVSKVLVLSGL